MPRYALDHGGSWVRADNTVVRYCSRGCAFALAGQEGNREPHRSITRESHMEHVDLDEDNEFRFDLGGCSHCGEALRA